MHLIFGFTATPDDHTLARFGEFSGYAEGEKLWVPFDSYTINEAIKDGFIHNLIVVAKQQTGCDEKRLHTLFLGKEIKGISDIQAISRVNRIAKHKHDCKIVDFSYNNVNVQNIKDAFEHFSDVVVSDFEPFSDKRILEQLFTILKKSDVYENFFSVFLAIANNPTKQQDPENYLDLESSLAKYINAHPKHAADTKAKTAQYFTILNCIEYVITIETKYSESNLLNFLRLFNKIYNQLHRTDDVQRCDRSLF